MSAAASCQLFWPILFHMHIQTTRTYTHTHTQTHTHMHAHTHKHTHTHTHTQTCTQVWRYDGTVECYTEGHLSLAIWAVTVLAIYALFSLFIPISTHVLLAVVSGQLKGQQRTHVYIFIYKRERVRVAWIMGMQIFIIKDCSSSTFFTRREREYCLICIIPEECLHGIYTCAAKICYLEMSS